MNFSTKTVGSRWTFSLSSSDLVKRSIVLKTIDTPVDHREGTYSDYVTVHVSVNG